MRLERIPYDIHVTEDDEGRIFSLYVEISGTLDEMQQLSSIGYNEFSIIDLEKPKRDLEALRKAAMFI